VLEAADGRAALQVAAAHDAPIHLLLTDVVMPDVNGPDLANRLTAVRPEMKVLFMSGYTDDAVVRHGILSEGIAYLQKPFTPRVLAGKVRSVLGGS
jgi:YesN/AraC family two-component response regulator